MGITKARLKQIIMEETLGLTPDNGAVGLEERGPVIDETSPALEEDEEFIDDVGDEDLMKTEAQTVVEEFISKMDNLASSVGFVPISKEPAVMRGLKDYIDDLAHRMRGEVDKADQKAAEEILSTRMGSYKGTTLPGGKRIK